VSGFVLDCSVAVSWCFEDEAAGAKDALLELARDEGAVVPSLWYLELGNVLLRADRRGRLSALRETLALARAEQLTSHDAAYLEVAMRRGLPLATKDRGLCAAAERIGVRPISE
jgi:predicted nucleic acid-binding protein